jgi:hypothetical protein
MDIKPTSSTIAALGQQGGQPPQKTNDLTKTSRKQSQVGDERAALLRTRKTDPKQTIDLKRPVDGAQKISSRIEIQAAQKNVENIEPKTDFHREAPMAIAGPPKFHRMGQIVDIKV